MKYFSRITSPGHNAKNKLEEAAKLVAKNKDQLLIESIELDSWIADIDARIKALNDYFRRCKPLTLSREKSHDEGNYIVSVSEVFTITLYKVRNS